MTERENFLERWSRKKTEATREEAEAPAAPPRSDEAAAPAPDAKVAPPSPAACKLEFDLSQLPSLDSITSATDIRAFLTPGVPQDLTRAALRRAWAADPAIRDFVGLAENAWDFTDPNAMPGFGDIPMGYDLKKMVAEVFGELEKTAEPASAAPPGSPQPQATQIAGESKQPAPEALPNEDHHDEVPALPASAAPKRMLASLSDDFVQRDNITASQHNIPDDEILKPKTRAPHGRALPK
jgi:hypothetical protein